MWSKEKVAEYNRTLYRERRDRYIELLGGACTQCGTTEQLEFDHVEPTKKAYDVAAYFRGSERRLESEMQKCQLLCKQCHKEKSLTEAGKTSAKGTHGTLSSFRYCRCEVCRAAKSQYNKEHDKRPRRRPPLEHGTVRMYSRGCRCETCRAANAAKMREYKKKLRTAR